LDSIRDFPPATASSDGGRWFLLDVIKAIGCVLIVWHHLAVYSPMFDRAMWLAPDPLAALYNHGQLAVQAFLVVAGFLSAAQLLRFVPENAQGLPTGFSVPRLLAKRYLRLAIPLMAALTLTVCVTALVRPWYPHDSLSDAPRVWTLVVHALMLQDLIGVPALSAGIWYVAIDLQLFTIALGCVWLAGLIQLRQPRFNLRGVTVFLWLGHAGLPGSTQSHHSQGVGHHLCFGTVRFVAGTSDAFGPGLGHGLAAGGLAIDRFVSCCGIEAHTLATGHFKPGTDLLFGLFSALCGELACERCMVPCRLARPMGQFGGHVSFVRLVAVCWHHALPCGGAPNRYLGPFAAVAGGVWFERRASACADLSRGFAESAVLATQSATGLIRQLADATF
jgi:hypothetical protein